MITQTPRLYLRPFTPDDGIHLYTLNADEEVLRYTPDKPFSSVEEAYAFVTGYGDYQQYGMGRWAVVRKSDDTFLGWCGLKYHPTEHIVEVGYRFHKKYWGNGYATEAAQASLEYGFSTLTVAQIYAHVHPENTASKNVLQKCGLHFLRHSTYKEQPIEIYRRHNPHLHLQTISARETYPVRHPVLRTGKPIGSCAFEGDEAPTTLHLGAFFKNVIVGVITLLEKQNPRFLPTRQMQLRGMAVLPPFQRKGIGEQLVTQAENMARNREMALIWMNAREIAIPFYQKIGYQSVGNPFTIADIGIHYVMMKELR